MPNLRPCDAIGDVQPLLTSQARLSGAEAVARYVMYRLRLLRGEWWEYPDRGNQILSMLQTGRLTPAREQILVSYFSAFILQTEGVYALEDVSSSIQGRSFRFSCRIVTEYGSAPLSFGSDLF